MGRRLDRGVGSDVVADWDLKGNPDPCQNPFQICHGGEVGMDLMTQKAEGAEWQGGDSRTE